MTLWEIFSKGDQPYGTMTGGQVASLYDLDLDLITSQGCGFFGLIPCLGHITVFNYFTCSLYLLYIVFLLIVKFVYIDFHIINLIF